MFSVSGLSEVTKDGGLMEENLKSLRISVFQNFHDCNDARYVQRVVVKYRGSGCGKDT